jgi:tripartite-type tricarboxylate transporter receptor subunit TctC
MGTARYLAAALVAALTIGASTEAALAQTYPSRPVTLIIPYPPGGFVDGLGRIIAKQFGTRTGGTMIVESRPGRDGIVGSYAAARAAPDGYTLLLGDSNPLTVAPLMHATLPYDPMADFARIATITSSNPIMIARAESPLKSITDVVDAAKARPGKLTYGSGTVGQQLMIEMLKVRANVSMLHVPYKGGSQVITDLLGGHVDLAATASANYINLRTKVVALAIASEARFTHLPEVPTMVELGYPGFIMGAWLGILGPRGLPPELVSFLTPLIAEIVNSPEFGDFAQRAGNQVVFLTGDEFDRRMIADRETLGPLVKAAGLKAE